MTAADSTAIRVSARWTVLLCAMFGLAAMHTIGHTGPHGGVRMDTAVDAGMQAVITAPALAAAPCSDGHCDGHGAMDGWEVCVAVLQGLTFLAVMVKHHEGAITMARQELAQGVNSEAKTLAQKIISDQQAQITTMKDIRASL